MYPILIAAALLAADPPPEREKALRTAVTTFADAFLEGKLRKAYPLVDEDSQEAFLDMAKIKLSKYEWQGAEWAEDFTRAKVTLMVDTEWKMPQVTVPVRRPWVMSWKWKDGEWLWVYEPPAEIQTPFGTLKARPDQAANADVDIEAEIKKNSDPEQLSRTVEVTQELTFQRSKPSEAEIQVKNGLAGHVTFSAAIPRIPGMKIDRITKSVGPGETLSFRLYWNPQPDTKVPDFIQGEIVGEPIGGVHPITFLFKD
jgi:hypothetical protein